MGKNTLNLTLSLDETTIAAFRTEAADRDISENRLINEIINRRYSHPTWPDLAEAAALAAELERVTGERDRARDTAVLHSDASDALAGQIEASITMGDIIANGRAIRAFRALGVKL
ncbi:hypothetical protein [Leucobacter sp. NPDC077196]|uniref:hypothetical protein n=1 Tax=Leucobacter sp. NPDC077196 TaxID=3154959 RepID=UPI00342E0F4F